MAAAASSLCRMDVIVTCHLAHQPKGPHVTQRRSKVFQDDASLSVLPTLSSPHAVSITHFRYTGFPKVHLPSRLLPKCHCTVIAKSPSVGDSCLLPPPVPVVGEEFFGMEICMATQQLLPPHLGQRWPLGSTALFRPFQSESGAGPSKLG